MSGIREPKRTLASGLSADMLARHGDGTSGARVSSYALRPDKKAIVVSVTTFYLRLRGALYIR